MPKDGKDDESRVMKSEKWGEGAWANTGMTPLFLALA
jgi:hypothetical protein